MSAFTLDIKGQLNNMNLSTSKTLWPLFEAIVNSIHSIEESSNCENGIITITAIREEVIQDDFENNEPLGRILSFIIEDNGAGFHSLNYKSFNTAYSTLKVKKGCKGIGRFLWLKAFASVEIESNFKENGEYFYRCFSFAPDGINPENNLEKSSVDKLCTKVKLNHFLKEYKEYCPVELDVIGKKIVEHCLLYFISKKCPKIILKDGESVPIDLNEYFAKNVKDSLHQDQFQIKKEKFIIYHLRLPEGANTHSLHLCANMQEVTPIELKKYVPDLQRKIYPIDNPKGFYYVGYVTSSYLDSIVNTARTNFDYDETLDQLSLRGTGKDTLVSSAIEYIKVYLSEYITDISKRKRKQIDDFVANERPTYRYLLNINPDVYEQIPAGLNGDGLELELHKAVQKWERAVKIQGQKLEEAQKSNIDKKTYDELFEKYWESLTEISKTSLAEYVTRRKTILKILEEALTIQQDGKFKKEEVIHSIICPMQHTSDDITFEEMNLWIVDERMAYHRFLASDKTLKSMPIIDSKSTKEPDIAIFDQAFAYTDSEEPFSSVTIVEFKKPNNDSKNPVNQVGEYIDLIKDGRKKKANGQSFSVTEGTVFRCYVICDLTDKMRTHCTNSSLLPMSDNLGYSGYNQGRHAYIEVISYKKLLADAKKRNQILFDKLFSPKLSEIRHFPDGEKNKK